MSRALGSGPIPRGGMRFVRNHTGESSMLIGTGVFSTRGMVVATSRGGSRLRTSVGSVLALLTVGKLGQSMRYVIRVLASRRTTGTGETKTSRVIRAGILADFIVVGDISSRRLIASFLSLLKRLSGHGLAFRPTSRRIRGGAFTRLDTRLVGRNVLLLNIGEKRRALIGPPRPFEVLRRSRLVIVLNWSLGGLSSDSSADTLPESVGSSKGLTSLSANSRG